MIKSLSTRIALMLAALLFCLMLASGLLIERQLTKAIQNEEVDQARLHAQTLLASLQTLMLNGQGTLAREWLDNMHGTAGIIDIEVLRRDGKEAFTDLETVHEVNGYLEAVVFEREPTPADHMPFPSHSAFDQALGGEVSVDLRYPEEITVLQPIHSDAECLACHGYDPNPLRGVLKLSLSREQGVERIAEMRLNLWMMAAIIVLVVTLLVFSVMRAIVLAPIARLQDGIARLREGERDVKLPVKSEDELGRLARDFNSMEEALCAHETRIRAVTDNVFDGIITTDERGVIETVNHATEQMFGYHAGDLIGRNVSMLMPAGYQKDHDRYIQRYIASNRGRNMNARNELVGTRKDGTTFPMELGLSEMYIGGQRFFVGVVRDITESKEQTAALEYQALHDALTELPNRALLSDRIQQSILMAQRTQQPLALLVMDLNRFKDINDTLGHKYGDILLQQVSVRMRAVLRESDTIARLGGDEFAVLLPRADLDHAKAISAKLLKAVEEPVTVDDQVLHVGASVGITLYPQHGEDESTLLQRADVAMYVAKRHQSGFAVYDPRKDQHSLRNLTLLGELRGAIDRQQLRLDFQPKVLMASGKMVSIEALVRWDHPKHGLMRPDEFVPLAEQTGMIGPLSLWVIRQSLREYEALAREGIEMAVAINLSVRNLQDKLFPVKVAELFAQSSVEPSRVRFEITETAIMADPARALAVLNELHAMGIRLSIDDFGTGYSSLAHLKQMPVDELKIDKNFVLGMEEDENDAVIVRSIIDLAHNIGIEVVAEGVETEQCYQRLRDLGCDIAQGNLISQPLSVEALLAWYHHSNWR